MHDHFNAVECIAHKRDGGEHRAQQIQALVAGYTSGRVTDYQMSAWLMAVFLRGLSPAETIALTMAMLHSGRILDFSSLKRAKVDKHSTGGVGDKISICLAPWVAACGVAVPMISGRGLGHTGGTLDKLEAIPGFNTQLSIVQFRSVLRRVGAAMVGQTPELAPADRKMYALRDVTATVNCVPLIVASILSKKLAEGLDGLVFDVKFGRGAFMPSLREAERLARMLVQVAKGAGTPAVALLTDMNVPLGRSIGNALETKEAFAVLRGKGPADTLALTKALGVEMLRLAGVAPTRAGALELLEQRLKDGTALRVAQRLVAAQGGDARAVVDDARMPSCKVRVPLVAKRQGYVQDIDALLLAQVANRLGAGRTRLDEVIDPAVGVELNHGCGDRVRPGDTLAWLHVRQRKHAEALLADASRAFQLGPRRPRVRPLVVKRITG